MRDKFGIVRRNLKQNNALQKIIFGVSCWEMGSARYFISRTLKIEYLLLPIRYKGSLAIRGLSGAGTSRQGQDVRYQPGCLQQNKSWCLWKKLLRNHCKCCI